MVELYRQGNRVFNRASRGRYALERKALKVMMWILWMTVKQVLKNRTQVLKLPH
ncbi:hypothetical protein HanXRQr2_Chr01g0019361 [Helianthus annuus]|uniref:Uncharacterized protein n=1 Tax=Helianthus annuus TaxID=4232 RepID=A0A9K3JVL9_HELAN|nr:hypothetical protein HanXRQr2_Chr01g0019361 [Helianthus annuus]KAJ0956715.1 hypothetical protein HanPSC8_Chr01g0018791 [Helianthus annuus]